MHLHYDVEVRTHGISLSGQADLDWHVDAQTYEARLETRTANLPPRVQSSAGAVTPAGLAPATFSDKARSELAVHFDRERARLVFSNNRPDAPLAPGMQDRLSVVLQLAALVAGDPARYPPGTQITVPTASARDAGDWIFLVEGEEDLDLPGGRAPVLKLRRLPRREYDQQVELWLAARGDYAPLRLRLTNPNGDAADLRWSSTDRP